MESPSTFGEWLRQRRTELHLTREQFASRVGCSVSAVRKIEDGERRPSGQIAELMANCLNIPLPERSTFEKEALLLTDYLEQLLTEPGVEVLAELLANAPHLKLVATSRESLGLHSEWVYNVQGYRFLTAATRRAARSTRP